MTVSGDLIYLFFLSCLSYNKKKVLLPNSICVKNSVCAILTSLKQSLSLALASFLLVLNYTTQFQSLSITIEHYLSVCEIAIISAFR